MYYDRTVSQSLLQELRPNGAFGYLAQLPRTWHLVDLQLRGYPNKSKCWATLYVGTTKVLDVTEQGGAFRLFGKIDDPAWDPAWADPHPASWFREQSGVGTYVRGAIGKVPERFTKEGAVQAMLCTRASHLFSVIDREAVIGFDDKSQSATHESLQSPLLDACKPDANAQWFKPPKGFGDELDILAVDDEGSVLVVEVKRGSDTPGIAWAPLQVTFYARLFRAWAEETGSMSVDSLQSMMRQRIELDLTDDPLRPLHTPLRFVPVVAIGGEPKSPQALLRLRRVQSALLSAGVGDASLEVWLVRETVGRTTIPSVPVAEER